MRLRYTGEQATTFRTCNVGLVEPQGEFDVPDDEAERFLRRSDIEPAGKSKGGKGGNPPPDDPPAGDPPAGDPPAGDPAGDDPPAA